MPPPAFGAALYAPASLCTKPLAGLGLKVTIAWRVEASLVRRLDRLTRQADRIAWHTELSNEALALFVRFWLTSNAPLPDTAMAAAQAMGRERYQGFVEALSRRMELGPKLGAELSVDVDPDRDAVDTGD